MNDTFDWPQWPALDVSHSGVLEYFQSMVALGDPLGSNLNDLNGDPDVGDPDVGDPGVGGGINSGNPGDELWGEAHFAPYVDMAGWPVPDLIGIAADRGVSLLNLGFITATADGQAAWGGFSTLTPGSSDSQAQSIDDSIAAFKAAGGDVMISLGGANGTTLAQSHVQRGLGAEALATSYAAVADFYSLNRIDFDIEGAAAAEPESIALRSEAIALLQQARPDLEVWYTLPVLPSGLTHDGLAVVDSALAAGVTLDGVNVMAMDYGESAAPTSGPNAKTMGAYAIESAESTHSQLTALFAARGQQFGWNQLGVTPMIGVNDVLTEVFTLDDAQALEDFAIAKGLGMVSMWSVGRDTPGSLGQATPNASGIDVPAGSFSNVWNDYGTINDMDLDSNPGGGGTGGGGDPVEGGTTTVISWNWGTDTVLDFDPAADKLDFGWFQPANFDVTEQAGSTRIEIVNNNQTYTLDGVGLNDMQIGNIVALDTNTVAKWRTLIDNSTPSEPQLPSVSIGNSATAEGNNGTSDLGFTVSLSEASTDPVTVGYSTSDGTATAGSDYVTTSGTVTFAPGVTSQAVSVGIVGDSVVEQNETFTVTLSNAAGATIADGSATGTITNDDVIAPQLPSVSVGDAVGAEGNSGTSNLGFTVSLSEASTDPVTVGYSTSDGTATAGSDYTATSGTLTFAPGVISQLVNVGVLGDSVVEQNETVTVTLSNAAGATIADGSATGTITNDDTAPDSGAASVVHTVTSDWGSGHVASITLTPGQSIDGWTLEFDTPAQITNMWNADIVSSTDGHYVVKNAAWNGAVGAGKSVELGYQATPGGAASPVTNIKVNGVAVGTPVPAPPLPSVSIGDAVKAEGDSGSSNLGLTVSLSEASASSVTVGYSTTDGTATAGSDYAAGSGTVTFAPGVTSRLVNIAVFGDTAVESDETFTVSLANAAGATIADGSAIGTITNDDVAVPAPLSSLSISDASVAEGDPGEGGIAAGYLSTSGNQIIDSQGETVKLAGVNWFGGETSNGVPHGLWSRSYTSMIDQMAAEGFNTIRLPYSNEMLHSTAAPTGIDYAKNPELQGMSRLEVMDEVIRYAGEKDLRIILDQHRSAAGNGPNSSGLWYEGAYTEDAWVADWEMLASRYLGNSTVIGVDLSNEPHNGTWGGGGATDWARAAERAGNAVLAVNPDLLIIVEGVETYQGQNYWWGGNLMGVQDRPITLDVPNRVVYSPHDYPNSVYAQPWFQDAGFAADLPDKYEQMWGYIYEQDIAPIMIGEFGTKLVDPKDEPWFEAITSYMSGDLDNNGSVDIPASDEGISWTYWSWNPNSGDTGGILADDWNTVNENKMVYLEPIQYSTDGGGNAVARFTVSLASASTEPVSVQYATSNGTATAGSDFVATSGAITFAPGVTSQTIEVAVLADTLVEPDETFSVTLSNPTGATLADAVGAGTITNDDSATDPGPVDPGPTDPGPTDPGPTDPGPTDPGTASVVFTKTSDWGSGFNGDVTVNNTGATELSDWQVEFDFPGTISSIWSGTIVSNTDDHYVVKGAHWNSDIAAGSSTSFGFTAAGGTLTNLALVGAVPSDPTPAAPVLSVANTGVQEGDSGSTDLVFNVGLSAPADEVVTVNYRTEDFTATAGSDYQAAQGVLTFTAGETAKEVRVAVLGDTTYETNESLILVLSDITGAEFGTSQGVGLISNDDANPNGSGQDEYRVVGYFAEWGIYGRDYHVADIPADKLTHINYAFADINDNGEVVLFDSFAAVEKAYPGDTWDQPLRGNFNQLSKLKEQNPDLETLIAIGGWTLSDNFSDIALTEASREKFAQSAVEFITTYGFDGIDLDWEYPVSGGLPNNAYRAADGANYVLLVEEIRRQLDLLEQNDGIDDKEYLLTIAGPAGYDKIANFDLAGMAPHLDWFNLMSYDLAGAWDNQTGHQAGMYATPGSANALYNVDHAVNLYLQSVDPSKIVLGSPLYGRSWTGVANTADGGLYDSATGAGLGTFEPGVIDYWHIMDLVAQQPDLYQVYWDDQAKVPYIYSTANGGTFITYENPQSLQYKIDYIKSLGLGGVMFWELDSDVRDADDPRSLIGLAASELLGNQEADAL
nr:cellulase family glycosylhydrolase [Actinomycetes bacterium]